MGEAVIRYGYFQTKACSSMRLEKYPPLCVEGWGLWDRAHYLYFTTRAGLHACTARIRICTCTCAERLGLLSIITAYRNTPMLVVIARCTLLQVGPTCEF